VSEPSLTVDRRVVVDMVRLAALEVPGVLRVGRAGPPWRSLGRRAVIVRHHDDAIEVRLWVVARPGQPVAPMAHEVRARVGAAVERLLGLRLASATVVVDGVGG
jgi:uncharacterized alkaline shock family protein YloU